MHDRNTIASSLTVEELDAFVTELAAKPGKERTLAAIKRLAAEKGIVISIESARSFRNTTFERHLEKIRMAQEVAMQVENIEAGGNTLAEASAKLLSKRIFTQLIDAEDEDGASEIDVDSLTLAISRLRRGDQQAKLVASALQQAQAKLREYEAREKDREEKAKEASKELEKLRDPHAGITDGERQAIVAKVDEILGIKVVKKA